MPGSTGEVSVPSSLDQRSPPPPGLRDGLVSRLGRLQCSSSTGPHTAAGGVEAESGASGDNTRWSLHLHCVLCFDHLLDVLMPLLWSLPALTSQGSSVSVGQVCVLCVPVSAGDAGVEINNTAHYFVGRIYFINLGKYLTGNYFLFIDSKI